MEIVYQGTVKMKITCNIDLGNSKCYDVYSGRIICRKAFRKQFLKYESKLRADLNFFFLAWEFSRLGNTSFHKY